MILIQILFFFLGILSKITEISKMAHANKSKSGTFSGQGELNKIKIPSHMKQPYVDKTKNIAGHLESMKNHL